MSATTQSYHQLSSLQQDCIDEFNEEVAQSLDNPELFATLHEPTLPDPIQTFPWCRTDDTDNPLAQSLFPMEFPEDMNYVLISKHAIDFEGIERGSVAFEDFARRKSDTRILEFHQTKGSYETSRCFEDRPHHMFLFVFDRTGKIVDGCY